MNSAFRDAGQQAGRDYGDAFAGGFERQSPRIQAAMVKAADATRRVREETEKFNRALSSNDLNKITVASNRLSAAHRSNDSALKGLAAAQSLATDGAAALAETTTQAGASMGKAGPAVAALAAGIGVLASVASSASGVLALLPAVAVAGAAGMGTLALATDGFGDALDNLGDPTKFAESLRQLSPNAQQAALDIRKLVPAFDEVKRSTQDALFQGAGQQLTQLATAYEPALKQMTTGIAGAINSGFNGVATQLMTPETMQALNETMSNIVQAFQNLEPAVAPLTSAFAELTRVGSSFLPQLATAASEAATSFNDLVQEASQSGDLSTFIQRGIDTIGMMIDVIGNVTELFIALGPAGEGAMSTIATGTQTVTDLIRVLSGDVSALGDLMPSVGESIVNTWNNIGSAIDFAFLRPMRMAIDLLNEIPGIKLPTIPEMQKFNPDGSVSAGGWGGGGGSFAPPGALPTKSPFPSATGTGGIGGTNAYGGIGTSALTPSTGPSWGPAPNPFKWDPKTGAYGVPGTGSGAGGLPNPTTAYQGNPLEVLRAAGLTPDSSNYGAAQAVLERRHDVEEKRSKLNALEKSNTATADDVTRARNDVMQAEQDAYKAELSLRDRQIESTRQYAKEAGTLSDVIDKDFGISKGLPGIAENLTKLVGSLATAGFQGQLKAIEAADPQWQAKLAQNGTMAGGYASSPFGPGYGQGGYPGDAALLSRVPAGSYTNGPGDLSKGLADCSSAVEDLVNLLDGKPTGGRSLATGNAADLLPGMGFQRGMGAPGDFRIGYNTSHMQATLPGGTPFNWGSDAAAARGGVGGTGADDPAFTDHWYRPTSGPMNITPSVPPTGLYSPANTGMGLTPPIGSQPTQIGWGPGGLPIMPTGQGGQGLGPGLPQPGMAGQAAGQPIAPVGGPAPGAWQPAATPNQGLGSMAGAAAAMIFPGAGEAAAKAGQLIDRGVRFGGQLAGIGISGLQETFGLSDPNGGGGLQQGWLGRLASGLAQTKPATPTTAGQTKAPAADPQQHDGSGKPPGGGLTIHGDFVQGPGQSVDRSIRELQWASGITGGMWPGSGRG